MTWRDEAACLGSSLDWMAEEPTDEHMDTCAACPVSDPCLEYAIDTRSDGVWAGTSKRDRRRLARRPA